MNNTQRNDPQQTTPIERVEIAIALLEIVKDLASQVTSIREDGDWTPRQKFSLWQKALCYKIADWRLKRWLKRISDPQRIHIPSRHALAYHAINKGCVRSALESLEQRGEYSCCIVPPLSKAQRQGIYEKSRKLGFEVRTEGRHNGFYIERLPR